MSAAGWDYVQGSWQPCCDCHTVRPTTQLQQSALEADAPTRLVCRDRVWCLRRVKEVQEKEEGRVL